jgi:hypothetical protein
MMDALFSNTRQWMAEKISVLGNEEFEAILIAGDALKKAFTEEKE